MPFVTLGPDFRQDDGKGAVRERRFLLPTYNHPGEGRGPIGKVRVTKRGPQSAPSPNWAPASAGVVRYGRRSDARQGAGAGRGSAVEKTRYFTRSNGVKSRNRQYPDGIDIPTDTVRNRSFRHNCPP